MTPRARASGDRDATATYAPRILKAPIGCRDSVFRNRCSSGRPKGTSGVRVATPRSVAAAARTATIVTSGASRSAATTGRSGSATTADDPLAVDAVGGPGKRFEPRRRDWLSAPDAGAVGAVVEPPQ